MVVIGEEERKSAYKIFRFSSSCQPDGRRKSLHWWPLLSSSLPSDSAADGRVSNEHSVQASHLDDLFSQFRRRPDGVSLFLRAGGSVEGRRRAGSAAPSPDSA
eukprot:764075-Hanusia_phi.AAC.3